MVGWLVGWMDGWMDTCSSSSLQVQHPVNVRTVQSSPVQSSTVEAKGSIRPSSQAETPQQQTEYSISMSLSLSPPFNHKSHAIADHSNQHSHCRSHPTFGPFYPFPFSSTPADSSTHPSPSSQIPGYITGIFDFGLGRTHLNKKGSPLKNKTANF